jgi:hypothetical protein
MNRDAVRKILLNVDPQNLPSACRINKLYASVCQDLSFKRDYAIVYADILPMSHMMKLLKYPNIQPDIYKVFIGETNKRPRHEYLADLIAADGSVNYHFTTGSARDYQGKTFYLPLWYNAIRFAQPDILNYVLKRIPSQEINGPIPDLAFKETIFSNEISITPLSVANFHHASDDIIRVLIKYGANPDTPIFMNGETHLTWAVKSENLPLIEFLLHYGANPKKVLTDGTTACSLGQQTIGQVGDRIKKIMSFYC